MMSNVAIVEAFINALISWDTETAPGHLDNYVQVSAPADLPMDGEYIGKAAFLDFCRKVTSTFEVEIDHRRVLDTGEVVLAVIDSSWTARRTGASIRTQVCGRFTVADRITAIQRVPERHPRTV
jgi:limonene-1,2-epoxide hydrolase